MIFGQRGARTNLFFLPQLPRLAINSPTTMAKRLSSSWTMEGEGDCGPFINREEPSTPRPILVIAIASYFEVKIVALVSITSTICTVQYFIIMGWKDRQDTWMLPGRYLGNIGRARLLS